MVFIMSFVRFVCDGEALRGRNPIGVDFYRSRVPRVEATLGCGAQPLSRLLCRTLGNVSRPRLFVSRRLQAQLTAPLFARMSHQALDQCLQPHNR